VVLISLSYGFESTGGYATKYVMSRGQCDARPTVIFLSLELFTGLSSQYS